MLKYNRHNVLHYSTVSTLRDFKVPTERDVQFSEYWQQNQKWVKR